MNSFLRSANTAFKSAKELEKNLASVGITKDKFLGKKDHAQPGQSGAPTDTPGNVPSNQVQQPQQSNLEGAPTNNHGAPSDTSGAGVSTYSQQQYQNQAGPQGNIYAPPKDGLTAYNYNQEPHYYQNTGVPSTNYPPTIASVPQQNAHGQVPQQQSYKPGQPESTSFPTSNQYTAHPGQHYDPHAQSALSNNNHGTPPSNNFNIAAPNQPGQYAPPPGVYNQPNVVGSPPTSPDISGVPPNSKPDRYSATLDLFLTK